MYVLKSRMLPASSPGFGEIHKDGLSEVLLLPHVTERLCRDEVREAVSQHGQKCYKENVVLLSIVQLRFVCTCTEPPGHHST